MQPHTLRICTQHYHRQSASVPAHLNGELAELGIVPMLHRERVRPWLAEVDLRQVLNNVVVADRLGALVDGIGQLLGGRSAVAGVVPAFVMSCIGTRVSL